MSAARAVQPATAQISNAIASTAISTLRKKIAKVDRKAKTRQTHGFRKARSIF